MGAEAARPRTEQRTLRIVGIKRDEAWLELAGQLIRVARDEKGRQGTVYVLNEQGDGVESKYVLMYGGARRCSEQVLVKGVDICDELLGLLESWDSIREERETIERAQAAKLLDYRFVPRAATEWEELVNVVVRGILSRRIIKTFHIVDGGRDVELGTYCYEDGAYVECEEKLAHEMARLVEGSVLLDKRALPTLMGTALKLVKIKTYVEWRPAKHKLLFDNKVVFDWDKFVESGDIEASLEEPSPELIVTHRIRHRLRPELLRGTREGLEKYVPPRSSEDVVELFKRLAPKSFEAFRAWVRREDEDESTTLSKVLLLLEVIGYTLYPHDYPLHKAVLLVGSGSNGKSTYINLIVRILGRENVSTVNLSDLDPRVNRFAASELYHKLANVSAEPVRVRSFDATVFKQLTGEDPVRFERKFRDAFTGYNYAKMIFAANELPSVAEDTYAFWRRWIVIEFPNRFAPDPEFFERTFREDEIEGIILCALHAFRLVLLRKSFTEKGVEEPREAWLSRSNPVYAVVSRMIRDGLLELDREGWAARDDVYALYTKYVELVNEEEGEDFEPAPKKVVTEVLERYFGVRVVRKKVAGKRYWAYEGIRIKDWGKAEELIGELETPRAAPQP
ncbi:MAG: phage/plasmid primase, P4 family [Desulfurococcaceae archaeon]